MKFEKGQDLVEYALLLTLVAILVIGAISLLGPMVASMLPHDNTSYIDTYSGTYEYDNIELELLQTVNVRNQELGDLETCPETIVFNGTVYTLLRGTCLITK